MKLFLHSNLHLMARIQIIALVGFTVLLFSCQEAATQTKKETKSEPKTEYKFPYNSIIENLAQGCFEDPADWFLFAGAEAEEIALNTFFPISEDMEIEAGEQIHEGFEYEYIEDERTQKLRNMLDEMRPYISRGLEYKIFLIKDDVINAWTIPGGYIYVTTGILDFIENDDELANVIGHEIGHNENKHTTKIIQRNAPRNIHPDIGVVVDVLQPCYNGLQPTTGVRSGSIWLLPFLQSWL